MHDPFCCEHPHDARTSCACIQSPEELDMPKRTKADMLGLMEWIEDILYTIATIVACSDSVVFFCLEPSLVKLLGLSCRRSAVMIGESNGFACFARTGHRHEHVRFNSTVSTWRQPALFPCLQKCSFDCRDDFKTSTYFLWSTT